MSLKKYLTDDGHRVTEANHVLYSGLSTALISLSGSLPDVDFRCAVTVSAITGHVDCAGSVAVGSDPALSFSVTGQRKTTPTSLSALPAVTSSGLDCWVLIEAISAGGGIPLQQETQVAIDCRFWEAQKNFQDSTGNWTLSQAYAFSDDTSLQIGKIFSYGGYDYDIKQMNAFKRGTDELREIWLADKTPAPVGRVTVVSELGDMLKTTYDTDADGVVDKAEGIPVLAELPADLSTYSVGDQFMVGNKKYTITDE